MFPAVCQLSYAVDCDASRRNDFVISHIEDTLNPKTHAVQSSKPKVTFSFAAWKEGHIAPSTWEFTVVKSDDKKTADKTNSREKK